jgi:undecaprenyl-diphosphatase
MRANRYGLPALLFAVLLLGTLASTGTTAAFDIPLLGAFALQQGQSPDWLIKTAQFVSWTGGGLQRYIMVALFGLLLGWWRGWRVGAGLVIAALLSSFASDLMKAAFARPRPSLVPHLDIVNNLSYPSGHATNAMVVYLFIALIVPQEQRRRWMIPMMILVLATGLSRMMLGVHYPSDVLGGWILGAGFAIGAAQIVNKKQELS